MPIHKPRRFFLSANPWEKKDPCQAPTMELFHIHAQNGPLYAAPFPEVSHLIILNGHNLCQTSEVLLSKLDLPQMPLRLLTDRLWILIPPCSIPLAKFNGIKHYSCSCGARSQQVLERSCSCAKFGIPGRRRYRACSGIITCNQKSLKGAYCTRRIA